MGAMAELDMGRQAGQPAAPPAPRRVAKGRPRVWVSFWWAGYVPTDALDPLRADQIMLTGKSADGRVWEAASAALEVVRDWMLWHGYGVLEYKRIGQRKRAGQWEGLYALQIGVRYGRR